MDQDVERRHPRGPLVLRTLAMPRDTNPRGDIFGGWILSQMDIAAGIMAAEIAQGRVVTVTVTDVVFHQPVAVGDEVSLYAHVVSSGRTSIRVHVEAWKRARTHPTNASVRVTQGVFTYVAIDQDRKPRPLPGRD